MYIGETPLCLPVPPEPHTCGAVRVGPSEWVFIITVMRDLCVLSLAKATFDAISKTYSYLTPDLWKETVFTKSPYQVRAWLRFAAHILFFAPCKVLMLYSNNLWCSKGRAELQASRV